MDVKQRCLVGTQQGVKAAEVCGEVLRRRLAYVPYAKGENESRERRLLALLDRSKNVARALLCHPFEPNQLCVIELVKVGRRMHDAVIYQLIDELVAQSLDIERAPPGKMQQRLLPLRRTDQTTGAARNRFVWQPLDCRTAFRALRRHYERLRMRGSLFDEHTDDFRNDVARAAHDQRLADATILAPHL